MSDTRSEYEVELFKNQGFTRGKCPKCGRFFWSLGDRQTCGEPPCDEYSFIGNSPSKKKLSLHEMRELYLGFFEKNGHGRVNRYPIVAKWRDDVFFTQASIYCFQPWVILGVVKPPSNPLTISQTCVRFNDIDNVGKTGRHFTMFEMMAHHAFNTQDDFVYFKDETVNLCHRLLTEDMGIPPENVSYIEAQWEGGGNSGPCFETIVNGVELATLVFMMYRKENGRKKEMDMQVVDTGYGLERFTWLSQGSSSAYEAVFGDVLLRLKKEAGISGDERILSEYSRVAGLMSVESNTDVKILRSRVAERLGISTGKLKAEIEPMENLYVICDHSRALMFMLQDGVVPSNVKEGYFARLLVRRTLRALDFLKLSIPLPEIVKLQVDYFKGDFPELAESADEILKLVDVEVDKYKKTVEKGRGIVSRLTDKLKKEGGDEIGMIGLDDLIELYDSHGLTPDLVREFSSAGVEIPDDFYKRVAQKHEKTGVDKGEGAGKDTKIPCEIPTGIPPTELGYYEDSGVRSFKANVLAVFDNYVILDKTYFYPEGGGQEADHGSIDGLDVVDVQKSANVVLHKVKGDLSKLTVGNAVSCELDWGRRIQLMQHHTLAHILNGAARKVLGNHIWQSGAHKSVKGARLDITHYAALSDEELREIESLANKVIRENRGIDIKVMQRDDAEGKYGFRLYQGGAVPGGQIRVVNIKDWDVEACGGLHFNNTGDIGQIVITGSKRIQDGVVRLEFVAGDAAKRFVEKQKKIAEKIIGEVSTGEVAGASEKDLAMVASIFSVPVEELPKTLDRFRDEWSRQRDELRDLEGIVGDRIVDGVGMKDYPFSEQYKEIPQGDLYESSKKLFEQWKSQRKELDILRYKRGDIFKDELERKFQSDFTEKDGVRVVKELVTDMDAKTLMEMAKNAVKTDDRRPEDRLLLLINVCGQKANVIVASGSQFHAGDLAKSLSQKLRGGGHGDKNFGIGGGSSVDAEKILGEFEP